jgi:hypothetical protein
MINTRIAGFILLLIVLPFVQVIAFNLPDTAKPVIRATKIEGGLKLTGDLADPRWKLAQPIELKYEATPGENTPAPQQTFVRILFDKEYIYQFTSEVFLRLIGQYDKFNKAVDFFPLVSYKLNAYTIFYIGSTYSLSDYGDPFGFRQTSRQYFLKLQYLYRS